MADERLIVALDVASMDALKATVARLGDSVNFYKVGMELFYAEGPSIVREIKARGHRIFLDLKLHDIPNTVKKAMHVLSTLDVDMTEAQIGTAVTEQVLTKVMQ